MRRQRSTKIVATLGPASNSEEMIARLFEVGADVFRINMSHTKHDAMRMLVARIRAAEARFERPIAILADLQGPKLRLGEIEGGSVELAVGDHIAFDLDTATPGGRERVPIPHPEILMALAPGHALLIDDGKMRLRTIEASPQRCVVVAETAGKLASRKGVSLPDSVLPVGALTPKDRSDLEAVLETGVDWIALSFVQRPDDVAEVKKTARGRAGVMSKIEKPIAVERLSEIMEISDALMVARGDLGVELPMERVPGIQKLITRNARRLGKPVVVATQMLESMISSPVPTRAEVSDVATAVFEGADAVMLSAESAAGQYPVEAVSTMDRIAQEVERDPNFRAILAAQRHTPDATGADAIAEAARSIAERLNLAAIMCWTASGSTALRVARERPARPILALTPSIYTARRLALLWGAHCVVVDEAREIGAMVDTSCRMAFREAFAKPGQRVIITAGVPLGTPGATNMLRIAFVGTESLGTG
jgi:pyruvate kinase